MQRQQEQQQPGDTEPRQRKRQGRSLPAVLLLSTPNSLLIVNAVILTVIVDGLLWYRWAVNPTQNDAGWLFAAGVLTLLVLSLLTNLRRLISRPRMPPRRHRR